VAGLAIHPNPKGFLRLFSRGGLDINLKGVVDTIFYFNKALSATLILSVLPYVKLKLTNEDVSKSKKIKQSPSHTLCSKLRLGISDYNSLFFREDLSLFHKLEYFSS
jgi:hypothetical protein